MRCELTPIEVALQRRDIEDIFFSKYKALRDSLFEGEYQFVISYFRGGNEHGVGHVLRVLERLAELLEPHALGKLNIYELYVLLASTVYHDIGLLRGRERHAKTTRHLIELEGHQYVTQPQDREMIKLVAEAHSSSRTIDQVFVSHPSEPERIGRYDLRHKYIAALLRIADELDEDCRRADERVRERAELPAESQVFWRINSCITGIRIDHNEKSIKVHIRYRQKDVVELLPSAGGGTTVWAALFEKMQKLNKERQLCSQYLRDEPSLRSVVLDFANLDHDEAPEMFVLHDHENGSQFFGSFPHLRKHAQEGASGERIQPPGFHTGSIVDTRSDPRFMLESRPNSSLAYEPASAHTFAVPISGKSSNMAEPLHVLWIERARDTIVLEDFDSTEATVGAKSMTPEPLESASQVETCFIETRTLTAFMETFDPGHAYLFRSLQFSGKTTLLAYLAVHASKRDYRPLWLRPTEDSFNAATGFYEISSQEAVVKLTTILLEMAKSGDRRKLLLLIDNLQWLPSILPTVLWLKGRQSVYKAIPVYFAARDEEFQRIEDSWRRFVREVPVVEEHLPGNVNAGDDGDPGDFVAVFDRFGDILDANLKARMLSKRSVLMASLVHVYELLRMRSPNIDEEAAVDSLTAEHGEFIRGLYACSNDQERIILKTVARFGPLSRRLLVGLLDRYRYVEKVHECVDGLVGRGALFPVKRRYPYADSDYGEVLNIYDGMREHLRKPPQMTSAIASDLDEVLIRAVGMAEEYPEVFKHATARWPQLEGNQRKQVIDAVRSKVNLPEALLAAAFLSDEDASLLPLWDNAKRALQGTTYLARAARWFAGGFAVSGSSAQALACCNIAIESDPGNVNNLCAITDRLVNLGENDRAIEAVDKAIQASPRSAEAWLCKYSALKNAGRRQEALQALDMAAICSPNDMAVMIWKAVEKVRSGEPQAGMDMLEEVITVNPDSPLALAAITYTAIHDTMDASKAIKYGKLLVQNAADKPLSWRLLAEAQEMAGDSSAQESWRKTTELDPNDIDGWIGLGVHLANRGDVAGGQECLMKAYAQQPENPDVLSGLSQICVASKNKEEAIQYADAWTKQSPQSSQAWFTFAKAQGLAGDAAGQRRSLERATELDAKNTDAWLDLGAVSGNSGDHAKALSCFEKVYQLEPDRVAIMNNMALAHRALGNEEQSAKYAKESVVLAEKWAKERKDAPDAWKILAQAQWLAGDSTGQRKSLEKATELDAKNADAWLELGAVLGNSGDHVRALNSFAKAYQLEPHRIEVVRNMALAHRALGNEEQSAKYAKESVALAEKWAEEHKDALNAWRTLVQAQSLTDDRAGMERSLRRITELDPKDKEAWITLGLHLANRGDLAGGQECFMKAYAQRPDDPGVLSGLSQICVARRNKEEAIRYADAWTKRSPKSSQAWFTFAKAQALAGDTDGQRRSLEKATESDAKNVHAWLELGALSGNSGDHAKALKAFQMALEADPNNPSTLALLSQAHRNLGNSAESVSAAERMIQQATDRRTFLVPYALAHLCHGSIEKAADAARECVADVSEDTEDELGSLLLHSVGAPNGEEFRDLMKPFLRIVRRNDDKPRDLYDLACYYAKAGEKDNMLWALSITVHHNSKYKKQARDDKDFSQYWQDPDFLRLTE